MRIGIIGGGAAGLTSAWLLGEHHEVTVFKKEDRPGGHAHTIEIEARDERVVLDAGFQFFGVGTSYARFNRLLDILEVSRTSYAATLTVFHTTGRRTVALPPYRRGWPVWASLAPAAMVSMLRFRSFLARIPAFLERHEMDLTIEEYIERQGLPRRFIDEFLYPLLLSFWCVELADFRRFAAYNALYYLGANLPVGITAPAQSEIVGGTKVYVDAIARALGPSRVRLGTGIRRVTQEVDGYSVQDEQGGRHVFDQLVVATNARQAARLIEPLGGLESRAFQLRRIRYFGTTIAIHGDRRLMPRRKAAWSVVNARWDGAHSALSIWNPTRGLPIFKSWVTFDESLPEPLYAVATYEHGMIDPDYFDAQRRLKAMQGQHGVWLAGLYTHDADSHESAIRSAITVAQGLAPDSHRLALLLTDAPITS